MKITAEIMTQKKPLWALEFLAHFPLDRNIDYDRNRLEEMRGVVYSYLYNFTYRQRKSTMKLCNTHDIHIMPLVMTISPMFSDTITIAIMFSDEKPAEGKCCICGCTDEYACYNPDYGDCWWVGKKHILCSHCAIEEIVNHPHTYCPNIK